MQLANVGIFKDKESGKKFFFLNTHLDHMGKVARHEGASLVLEEAHKLSKGLPVIVTGDFNATPDDDPIKVLTDKSDPRHVIHTREVADLARNGLSMTTDVFLLKRENGSTIFS